MHGNGKENDHSLPDFDLEVAERLVRSFADFCLREALEAEPEGRQSAFVQVVESFAGFFGNVPDDEIIAKYIKPIGLELGLSAEECAEALLDGFCEAAYWRGFWAGRKSVEPEAHPKSSGFGVPVAQPDVKERLPWRKAGGHG